MFAEVQTFHKWETEDQTYESTWESTAHGRKHVAGSRESKCAENKFSSGHDLCVSLPFSKWQSLETESEMSYLYKCL